MSHTVLYLVPDLYGPPGGIARYCRMVCAALAEAGWPLCVLALNDEPASQRKAASADPAVHYLPMAGNRARFVVESLRQARTRPALVLIGHPNFGPVGWTAARLACAPAFAFMYGIDVWTALPGVRGTALRKADAWIAISRYTAARAAAANRLPLHRIRILNNCLDPALISLTPAAPDEEGLSMLTVGRIDKTEGYKGHDQVIRALPELLTRFPGLRYDVVGDGSGRMALESLARELGVADAVRFHGQVSETELTRRYASASFFVMPSRAEGFGFVFAEAMAYGKPAIGGNADATPEVIVDGETGFVVDPDSVEAIAAAAARLLGDHELRHRMGEAAAKHVRERFGYERFRSTLLEYLAASRSQTESK